MLDQNAAKLAEAEDELTSSKASYEEGLASYQEQEANAQSQLDDAQAEIDDAQAQVDALEQPDVFLLDRTQDEGVETYMQDTRRMDGIANVFPVFFFLVAALVALTTMTRMVEDDRVLIGTLKALGYSKGRIASRYLRATSPTPPSRAGVAPCWALPFSRRRFPLSSCLPMG